MWKFSYVYIRKDAFVYYRYTQSNKQSEKGNECLKQSVYMVQRIYFISPKFTELPHPCQRRGDRYVVISVKTEANESTQMKTMLLSQLNYKERIHGDLDGTLCEETI